MSAMAYGTGTRYLGFGGGTAIGVFAAGVIAAVVGALVLADGALAFYGANAMTTNLNLATLLFGNLAAWISVTIGVVVAAAGGALVGYSRYIRP